MNDLNSYQESLDQYQDTSIRTETDEELEQQILDSAPTPEDKPAIGVKHNADGTLEEEYPTEAVTQPVDKEPSVSEQISTAREEDREYQKTMFTEASDWIAEKLGFDMEERERVQEERRQRAAEVADRIENADGLEGFTRDAIRVIPSAIDKTVQDAIGFANFAGDFAKTKLGMVEEDDVWNNTDHKNYIGSQRDLIMAEPRSQAGQFARDMVSFVVMQRQAGAVTGLNKVAAGKGLINPQRLAAESTLGAMADFIMDPGDSNASNALTELFPSLKGSPLLAAFAHADDDDEFTRRLKNTIEGGVMGVAVDAVGTGLKGLFDGAKPYLDWISKNPGKRAVDAPAEVKEQAVQVLTDTLGASDTRPRLVLKQTEMTKVEQTLPNGETVNWYYTPEEIMGGEITHYDVSWDMASREGKIGTGGKSMVSEFRKQVKDLEPGTVISAQPLADDELGSGAIKRSAAQERAMAKNMAADDAARLKQAEDLWIEENADQFPMKFEDGTGYETAKEAWDDLDDAAKDTRLERFETEGKIEKGHVTGKSNVRGNIYTRMGFGNVDPYHGTQFGVVQADGSIKPIDLTLKSENRVEELAEVRKAVDEARADAPEGSRPGYTERVAEDYANGGTKSRQDYEPYERAGKTAEFPISKVIDEQEFNAKAPSFTPGAPSPVLTDNTIRQINEAGGDVAMIEKAVDELGAEIGPMLRSKDPAVVKQAEERLIKLIGDNAGDEINMSALTDMVDEDGLPSPFLRTALGNKVAKTYMRDAANQVSELMSEARQITDTGMDANRQYNLAMDRLKAVARLQIRDGSRRGSALQSLKAGIGGITEEAVSKRVKDFDDNIEKLRTRINEGDVEAVQDMKVFADSLVLADGDPDLAMSFTEKFFKYGRENFETTMFNSYLSGLVTQERNILGNSANIILKPFELMLGSLGNPKNARAAASMYVSLFDSFGEGFRIAKTTLANNVPDAVTKTERVAARSDMGKRLENLRATAKNPAEHTAATLLTAQYNLMAAPWAQGATRMLEAADRGFRVVSARQKAKFDAVQMSIEDGIRFDPRKFELNLTTKFKNGDVVDETLLNWAKKDTFQEDLGETMGKVADLINTVPGLKYLIPFVKTPTNIIKQSGNYVPLLGRLVYSSPLGDVFAKEYTAVMRGTDEAAKAVYRGREGFGILMGVTMLSAGYMGNATGQGPADPQLREIWLQNNRPHSIKVGDTWVSNRFLGPLGILMSAYADIGTIAANRGTYDTVQELASQLMYATAGSLADQSWLRGAFSAFEGIMDIANGKTDLVSNADEWVSGLMRAMTPYQAAMRSWNNTLVPGLREYNNDFEKYAAETIPFAKKYLGAERISPFTGEPVANGGLSALNQAQPFSLAEVKNDEVVAKLIKYGIDVPIEFQDKYKGVALTVQENAELNKIMARNGLRKDLKDYFDSRWFNQDYEDWKNQSPPIPREKAEWYKEARGFFNEHRDAAISEYSNSGTYSAKQFKEKIEAIDARDFYGRKGNYKSAGEAQQFINEVL